MARWVWWSSLPGASRFCLLSLGFFSATAAAYLSYHCLGLNDPTVGCLPNTLLADLCPIRPFYVSPSDGPTVFNFSAVPVGSSTVFFFPPAPFELKMILCTFYLPRARCLPFVRLSSCKPLPGKLLFSLLALLFNTFCRLRGALSSWPAFLTILTVFNGARAN